MKTSSFTQPTTAKHKTLQRLYTFFAITIFLLASFFLQAQDVLMGLTSNGGPQGAGTAFSFKTDTKTFAVVNGFANWGESPVSGLVKGSDGSMYGMTPIGGTYNSGTIFRITTSGTVTILKQLNIAIDGGYPKGSLIQAKDGAFYGTAESGGPSNGGVLFKITADGQYTLIKSMSINTEGGRPCGRLIQATDGNFYGVNRSGGTTGYGTIFRLKPDGTYTILKTFTYATDGGNCYGGLVQGTDSALYGMTRYGGTYGYGTIFRISLDGTQFTVLKQLNRATDAAYPSGDLIQAKDGYLYGLASSGIGSNGVAFRLKMNGSSFSVLHQFVPGTEGGNPYGSLVQGTDGYFYGTVSIASGGYAGGVFKMSTSGSTSSVKKFTATTDGEGPLCTLIQLSDGYLYGTTQYGGKNADGTIFKINTSGSTFSVLAHMNGATLGNTPQDNLALGKDSAYFGLTHTGGAYNWGTIYKICGGTTTLIRSFDKNTDGGAPSAGLVRGKDGNLYGATETGGSNGGGTIFRITPTGSFNVLYNLKSTTDGEGPRGTLAVGGGTDSALYGITYAGGTNAGGTIFKITPKGVFTVLRHLVPSTDGDHCDAGLTFKDSVFYGITGYNSRFFKINPNGFFTVIKTLNYGADGNTPLGNMIVGKDGLFYGTLSTGGTYGKGVVFKITTSGTLTKLRHINGTTDGSFPRGSLVQTADSAVYGTTFSGGANGVGTIYKITNGGTFSVVKSFAMATDGGNSLSGLIIAPKISAVANGQTGLTTAEDVAKAITLTGSGGANLTFSVVTKPKHGSVSSSTGASRTYTPSANYNGVDSFAFTTNVGCLASAPAWVKITVTAVNDAPVLSAIGNKTVMKGSALTFTATATDPDAGQTKTFSLITPPSGAVINPTTGAFSWTPSATGTFTFKVRVTDNGSPVLYDEETITVTVTASALVTVSSNAMQAIRPEEKDVIADASMYPNPVVSSFTLAWKQPVGLVKLVIVDAKGMVMYSKQYKSNGNQLQVTDAQLTPGAYVAMLQIGNTTQALKFIKQ